MLFHHVHIKCPDPAASADWWSTALGLTIESDEVRAEGDRFIKCRSENGVAIFISGPRNEERLSDAVSGKRFGLEHVGFHTHDITGEIERLVKLGAQLITAPERLESGSTIAFLHTPDAVRIELVQPEMQSGN